MAEKIDKYFKLLHPEHDTLTPGEQFKQMDDRDFIAENLDNIELTYLDVINKGRSPEESIKLAVKFTKANKYYEMLHSNSEELSGEELLLAGDAGFIIKNFDNIETMYQTALTNGQSPEEAIREAVRLTKANRYFEILHPEYETLTPGEQLRTIRDKSFIEDHIEEIDEMYTTYVSQAERRGEEINKQKIINTAVNLKKADRYFELLHPEYKTLTPGEQLRTIRDKSFIEDHIEEIDEMYTTYVSQAERRGEEINKQKIINTAINCTKTMRTTDKINNVKISLQDIESKESEEIMPIDESKFAEIHSKAKGIIKGVFSKIKSFFNIKSNDRNDKTNDENTK